MIRTQRTELLDALPLDHPDAHRSRRDLVLINRLMGNWLWQERSIRACLRSGDRLLEIGASGGDFMRWLARRGLGRDFPVSITGLDLAPRPGGWPAHWGWLQEDLTASNGLAGHDVVVANLTLHHFDSEGLRSIGRRLADGARAIFACEPARRRPHVWQARGLALLGVNRVTRHDAPASVEAGFLGRELPVFLGLDADPWRVTVTTTWLGGYRMAAVRRGS